MYQDQTAAAAASSMLLNVLGLVVASGSLVVSLIAFRVAKDHAATSIAAPLALQELYEITSYFDGRKLDSDLAKDWERLVSEIALIRRKDFILRKTGFSRELDLLEEAVARFVRDREGIVAVGANATDEDGRRLSARIADVDQGVQSLLKSIRTRMDELYTDPFRSRVKLA